MSIIHVTAKMIHIHTLFTTPKSIRIRFFVQTTIVNTFKNNRFFNHLLFFRWEAPKIMRRFPVIHIKAVLATIRLKECCSVICIS